MKKIEMKSPGLAMTKRVILVNINQVVTCLILRPKLEGNYRILNVNKKNQTAFKDTDEKSVTGNLS